jgi:hypothetical protein
VQDQSLPLLGPWSQVSPLSICSFQQRVGHWFISLGQFSQVSPFSWILLGQVALQLQTSFSQVRQVSHGSIIPFQQVIIDQVLIQISFKSIAQVWQVSHLSIIPFQHVGLLISKPVQVIVQDQSLPLLGPWSQVSPLSICSFQQRVGHWFISLGQFSQVSPFS